MKKILSIFLVLITAFVLIACGDLTDIESISLNYQLKDKYVLNEEVNLEGVTVKVTKTTGETYNVDIKHNTIKVESGLKSGTYQLDTSVLGTHTFKITYEGVSVSLQYVVESVGAWDGTTLKAVDPVDNVYTVTEGAELAWIAQESITNSFEGKTIKITQDIDMGNHDWQRLYFLKSATIDGLKEDGGHSVISGLTRGLIYWATDVTVKNLVLNFNVETSGSFAGVIGNVYPENYTYELGDTNRVTTLENIKVTGKVFALGSSSAFVLYGRYDAPEAYQFKEDIKFINVESDLELTTLQGNSAFLVGHNGLTRIYVDNKTMTQITGKIYAANTDSTLGRYFGYSIHNAQIFIEEEIETNVFDYKQFTTAQFDLKYENRNLDEKINAITNEFNVSMIGTYVGSAKVEDASKFIVIFEYQVGAGYPRRITKTVDISSLNVGDDIVAPIKFQYVSQLEAAQNWVNYIYNDEALDTDGTGRPMSLADKIRVLVFQVDSHGLLKSFEKYEYSNKPNGL